MPRMQDNTTPALLLPGMDAYAGYVAGSWPDDDAEVIRFPGAPNLSITPFASVDADCLDIEKGDATVSQAPGWVQRQHARGLAKPYLYTSLANVHALITTLQAAGIDRSTYFIWSAHYTFVEHICTTTCGFSLSGPVAGTQWTDRAAGNDQSLISPAFLAGIPAHGSVDVKPTPVTNPDPKSPVNPVHPVTPVPPAHRNVFTPLVVDGDFGPNTIKALQFVTFAGNQGECDGDFGPNSKRSLQGWLHVAVDGVVGQQTVHALQVHVGANQDGSWGPMTTRALQAHLNAGTF